MKPSNPAISATFDFDPWNRRKITTSTTMPAPKSSPPPTRMVISAR